MSLHPSLYRRKVDLTAAARCQQRPLGPYVLTWADGAQQMTFQTEAAALAYADWTLRVIYGATRMALTGPDATYELCACGCGRLFRDGTGVRLGTEVLHADCPTYRAHPAIVGARQAAIAADAHQDVVNAVRR